MPAGLRRELARRADETCPTDGDRMRLALSLAALNVAHGWGGPFGAAVFERRSGRLVAAGVNLVVHGHCCCLHAEIVALMLAQQRLGTHDLAAAGDYELQATTAPCAMCLGAVVWSGVSRLVCAARGADAEALGFDEGPKPDDWTGALRRRGIAVRVDFLRRPAVALLRDYAAHGGAIYGPRRTAARRKDACQSLGRRRNVVPHAAKS